MILTLLINNIMNFINNKYTVWYQHLIATRKNRVLPKEIYVESHHIIPRSLGGTNLKDNKIKLLPREHFIAHLLLTKMVDGQDRYKMWKAFNMMLTENKVDQSRYYPTSRFYELARKLVGQASSDCNKGRIPWNKGIPRSIKVKEAVSKANTGKTPWNKGIPRTLEEKILMSAKRKETAQSTNAWNKGQKLTLIECEYCKKMVGGEGNYTRWHGKNCKEK